MLNGIDTYRSSAAKFSGAPAQILITGTLLDAKVAYRDFNETEVRNRVTNTLRAKGWSVDSIEVKQHPTIKDAALFWIVVNGNTSDNLNTVVQNFKRHILAQTQQVGATFLTKPVSASAPQAPVSSNNTTVNNNTGQAYPDFIVKAQGVYKNTFGNPDADALLLALTSSGYGVKKLKITQKNTVSAFSTIFAPKAILDTFSNYTYNIDIRLSGYNFNTSEISQRIKPFLETQFQDVVVTTVVDSGNASGGFSFDDAKTPLLLAFGAVALVILLVRR